jgi:hypothetical protein
MQATLQTVTKNTKVYDFTIDIKGVKIQYAYWGIAKNLHLDREESCSALYRAGIIKGWSSDNMRCIVIRFIDDNGEEQTYSWLKYTHVVGLWQSAAFLIARNEEYKNVVTGADEEVEAMLRETNSLSTI